MNKTGRYVCDTDAPGNKITESFTFTHPTQETFDVSEV